MNEPEKNKHNLSSVCDRVDHMNSRLCLLHWFLDQFSIYHKIPATIGLLQLPMSMIQSQCIPPPTPSTINSPWDLRYFGQRFHLLIRSYIVVTKRVGDNIADGILHHSTTIPSLQSFREVCLIMCGSYSTVGDLKCVHNLYSTLAHHLVT